jgi:hypothetical protein
MLKRMFTSFAPPQFLICCTRSCRQKDFMIMFVKEKGGYAAIPRPAIAKREGWPREVFRDSPRIVVDPLRTLQKLILA